MAFELYSYAASFYSQKAQLALKAKGIEYVVNSVDLLKLENLQPWFLKINPAGKVPTLKHGDTIIPDSDAIVTYLDQHCGKLLFRCLFDGPKLHPDPSTELGKSEREFYNQLHGLEIEVLTFGSFLDPEGYKLIRMDEQIKAARRDLVMSDKITQVLEGLMKENPEMHDLYKDRLTRAQQTPFAQRVGKQNWEAAKVKLMAVLTAVEEQLNKMDKENGGKPSWLFEPSVTAADIQLTMTLVRMTSVGVDKQTWLGKLPKVERYFTYAKENLPGFKAVVVF